MILGWIILSVSLLMASLGSGLILSELFRVTLRNGVPSLSSTWAIVDKVITTHVFPVQGLILDLGCGNGWTLRRLWRSGLRGPFVGYEKAFVPWLMGWFWNKLSYVPVKVVRQDFSQAPIEQAKGVYLFLLPSMLEKVGNMIKRRAKPGTVVVSAEFQIPGWTPDQTHEARGVTRKKAKIYVYRT